MTTAYFLTWPPTIPLALCAFILLLRGQLCRVWLILMEIDDIHWNWTSSAKDFGEASPDYLRILFDLPVLFRAISISLQIRRIEVVIHGNRHRRKQKIKFVISAFQEMNILHLGIVRVIDRETLKIISPCTANCLIGRRLQANSEYTSPVESQINHVQRLNMLLRQPFGSSRHQCPKNMLFCCAFGLACFYDFLRPHGQDRPYHSGNDCQPFASTNRGLNMCRVHHQSPEFPDGILA